MSGFLQSDPHPYQAKVYNLPFLLRSQYQSSSKLEKLQLEGFQAMVDFAKNNCAYYRNLPNVKSLGDIKDFPILTKTDISKNFKQILVKRVSHRIVESGGTVSKVKLAKDMYLSQLRTGLARFESWYTLGPIRHLVTGKKIVYYALSTSRKQGLYRVAHLWGSIEGKDFDWTGNRLWLPVEKLINIEVAEKYLKALENQKPHFLHGYALPLAILARYAVKLGIRPAVGVVRSECETLTPTMRRDIEEGFLIKHGIYNFYGSRELGEIAQDCKNHTNLHTFAERYIIEVVDGRFLITDLLNYAFPLIRYENQDVGEFSNSICSCTRGLPTIKPLVGRVLNYLKTKSGNWVTGFIVYLPIMYYDKKHKTKIFDWVEAYQIRQQEEGKITILLKPWSYASPPENLDGIYKIFQEFIHPEDFDIEVKIVNEIPKSRSGKQLSVDTTLKREW